MYKRTKKSIINHPPDRGWVMVDAQFSKAKYSDIAFAITTRVDSNGAYYVIVDEENTNDIEQSASALLKDRFDK